MVEGGIGALGLDAQALVFQVINFALLLGLLRLFAYKPVLKILESRRQKVAESLRTADELAAAKIALERRVTKIVQEAQTRAQQIVAASEQRAQVLVTAAEAVARQQAAAILKQTQAQLAQEVVTVRAELKRETLQLVAQATEKLLGEKLNAARDERLIAEAVTAAEQELKQA